MEQRRQTDANPENNCERYNRSKLVHCARERTVPIVRFEAQHDGVRQEEGMAMDDQLFSGLSKNLEVSEHARVIITANLSVEHGLMNGTQGVVKQIIYPAGSAGPNATDPAQRMPTTIVVDCPKYGGFVFTTSPSDAPGYLSNHVLAEAKATKTCNEHSSL